MVEIAGNGGIDQAALTQFERNFMTLAQQKQSKLEASGVVRYLPTDGKYNTLPRIGKLELVEVNGRNPLKQYTDYSVDNRMLRKRRFTTSVLLDNKNDVNELIADPTSYIMEALIAAKNRSIDRVITSSAIGPVLVGSPNGPQEYLSAEDDGVATVDATSGVNYGTYTAVTEMFINKEIPMDMIERVKLLITGKENTALMNEDKFINNRYISARPVEKGVVNPAGVYDVILFAGSVNGGITVENPILPEETTIRHCLALAPESIAVSMELASLRVEQSSQHVNSKELTIDFWINGMRTEGARVIDVKTTI
nr:MAG TPA: major capsid protein [Caudoviricetes sp.]